MTKLGQLISIAIIIQMTLLAVSCKARGTPSKSAIKVVGGKLANTGQFPASVYIPSCSATRIGTLHILTAAHCVLHKKNFELLDQYLPGTVLPVRYGVEVVSAKLLELKIVKTSVHTSYKSIQAYKGDLMSTDVADFALIQVESIPDEVAIATLSPGTPKNGQSVIFTGYGCEVIPAYMRPQPTGEVLVKHELTEDEEKLRLNQKKVQVLEIEENMGSIANDVSDDFAGATKKETFSGCPGDSGSAVYLDEASDEAYETIIGVNAFINRHRTYFTRVDKASSRNIYDCVLAELKDNTSKQNGQKCLESPSAHSN